MNNRQNCLPGTRREARLERMRLSREKHEANCDGLVTAKVKNRRAVILKVAATMPRKGCNAFLQTCRAQEAKLMGVDNEIRGFKPPHPLGWGNRPARRQHAKQYLSFA